MCKNCRWALPWTGDSTTCTYENRGWKVKPNNICPYHVYN